MPKIIVDVISARNLHSEDGLLGKNDPYLVLKVGHLIHLQKHKTRSHKNAGSSVDFNETFEFDVRESDDLKVRLFDDDLISDDKVGEAKVPLKGVFQTGQVESWYQIGEGSKTKGEVLLRIRTA